MSLVKKIKKTLSNFRKIIKRPEMQILPGQLAFFFVLAVVPILTLISYAATFFHLPINSITDFISNTFSANVASTIVPSLTEANFSFSFIFLIVVSFFIASNGCKSLILTSNTIYGIKPKRELNTRIKALIMTILLVMLFLFILIVPLFGNLILSLFEKIITNEKVLESIYLTFRILKGPITWLILFIITKLLYTMAPDKKIPSASVNLGSLFTTIGWTLLTAIYSYYITNVAVYDRLYAGLSNIVILMLWVYLLAQIFTIGLALNYREEKQLAKTGIIPTIK